MKSGCPGADNIIVVRDLHYARGQAMVFDGLDLEIRRGGVTAIMGPSGTGKTTLLRLITGQEIPDRGSILFDGDEVTRMSRRQLFRMRRRVGMLFQNGALLTDLNVYDNVAFPLREHTRLPERLIRHIVLTKLHAVGLRGAWRLMPAQLSGGMARRVALARAIVMDPDIIYYDEPFVGLDPISMGVVVRLIRRMNDALGLTSVVVTHDVDEVSTIADCSFLLADGRVAATGTPEQLRDHHSETVTQFMQGMADGPVPFHYPAPDYGEQLLAPERD
ncbi:ATP-binding cassette domain-containing protein [Thioalkalivibrio sp. XN8]|uniref:ABC transporter ATP-binding protein n=1 Tax=Thioalkalivibrio sp. XN8 TaxID=2712863 RepID=UPI0013EBC922|nr:ATP-binding cassette domain-containing protein [Thioalkalivibrio sp. XN8]NGP54325.1 ATP-binding cassette domain-containing protein [Thioalkalivibrio sp. XN8]